MAFAQLQLGALAKSIGLTYPYEGHPRLTLIAAQLDLIALPIKFNRSPN
jgi:hypothetical protein